MENLTCKSVADYSNFPGDKILPFKFELNKKESVLYPADDEYQKFCYDISSASMENSKYYDLEYFLLGICSDISREDIIGVTVKRNGTSQSVIWGLNVELKKIDKKTGCSGLKFDFPLGKIGGKMKVCITLKKAYNVGPINVCLFGSGKVATGLSICGPVCSGDYGCKKKFVHEESVSIPISITPYAIQDEARVVCKGAPIIESIANCPECTKTCKFTITQNLSATIPITFGAIVESGEVGVKCKGVNEEACKCKNEDDVENKNNKENELEVVDEANTSKKGRLI